MNKSDLMFIVPILIISIIFLIISKIGNNNYAYVYYDNNIILKIDLTIDDNYKVKGYNGDVLIEVKSNKLRVYKENSPLHICSKQDFTNTGSIVCLPNKIVITFAQDDMDAVIG